MQRVERSARIEASPEVVFAYVSNLDTLAEWQSGLTSARRTSDGEVREGATAEVTREIVGQRITAPLLVTLHEPPRRLGIASTVAGVEAAATLVLTAVDRGAATELSFAMEIRGSGLTAFMEPAIANAARDDIDRSLARLAARFGTGEPVAG